MNENESRYRLALLHIIGDLHPPNTDPWQRCREIAAVALRYSRPEPMEPYVPPVLD